MKEKRIHCSISADRETINKFKHIAEQEERSLSNALEQCMKRRIAAFESKYGPISSEQE